MKITLGGNADKNNPIGNNVANICHRALFLNGFSLEFVKNIYLNKIHYSRILMIRKFHHQRNLLPTTIARNNTNTINYNNRKVSR